MFIVLDKSYLQGANRKELDNLFSRFEVVMPHGLFYEILTGDSQGSIKCWKHIPEKDNPMELCNPISELLKYEIRNSRPVSIDEFFLKMTFRFNSKLKTLEFDIGSEQKASLGEWQEQVNNQATDFLDSARTVSSLFPEIVNTEKNKINGKEIDKIIKQLLSSESSVQEIYSKIRSHDFPKQEIITRDWAFFRWVQVRFICYLQYVKKYGIGPVPINMIDVEHDLHDMEYCIIGSLIGRIATRDKNLKRIFNLICPDGTLIS